MGMANRVRLETYWYAAVSHDCAHVVGRTLRTDRAEGFGAILTSVDWLGRDEEGIRGPGQIDGVTAVRLQSGASAPTACVGAVGGVGDVVAELVPLAVFIGPFGDGLVIQKSLLFTSR